MDFSAIKARLKSNLVKTATFLHRRYFSQARTTRINQVKELSNWKLQAFKDHGFNANIPVKLPFVSTSLPSACHKWFIHDNIASSDHKITTQPASSELRSSFWSCHETTIVPLELTTRTTSSTPGSSSSLNSAQFSRASAPLKILLTYLSDSRPTSLSTSHSIYLAQCDLNTLPTSIQQDLPTPLLVTSTGKGDIYSSSLWLGRPPTYTPLHRDPNPNLFLQLAGHKVVRLFPPEVGEVIFDDVQTQLAARGSSRFRGEEMMAGPETEVLHRMVWKDGTDNGALMYVSEAKLGLGEGLFIPKGWWHSVKGVGEGITASANWWFR